MSRRAKAALAAAPRTAAGDSVLDLGCGDGVCASLLLRHGVRYRGIDLSGQMIAAARAAHPDASFEVADLVEYVPPEPVDVTFCFGAFYFADLVGQQKAFFRRVAAFTRAKFVFDFQPSTHVTASRRKRLTEIGARRRDHPLAYDPRAVLRDLAAAGFSSIETQPFLLPQKRRVPSHVLPLVSALERSGPIAKLALARRGLLLVVATHK